MTLALVNLSTGPDLPGADTLYAAFTKVNIALAWINLIQPAMVGGPVGLIKLSAGSSFSPDAFGNLGVVAADAGTLLSTDIAVMGRGGSAQTVTLANLASALAPFLPVTTGAVAAGVVVIRPPIPLDSGSVHVTTRTRPVLSVQGTVAAPSNQPLVTSGLAMDFNPGYAPSVNRSGTVVTNITDSYAGSVTLVKSSSANLTYVANGLGNKPIFRNTGNYDVLLDIGTGSRSFANSFFTNATNFTFEFIIKQTAAGTNNGYASIFNNNQDGSTGTFQVTTNTSAADGSLALAIDSEASGGFSASENGGVPLNVWHVMLIINDGSTISLYRDGTLALQVAVSGGFSWAVDGAPSEFFHGGSFDVARWRAFSRALSSAEITQEVGAMRTLYGF